MTETTNLPPTPADAATGQGGALDAMTIQMQCISLGMNRAIDVLQMLAVQSEPRTADELYLSVGCQKEFPVANQLRVLAIVGFVIDIRTAPPRYYLNRPGLASFAAAISALGQGTIGGGR